MLFIPTVDKNVLSIFIYLTLTVFNLVLPMLWLVAYIYLSIKVFCSPIMTQCVRNDDY